MFHRRLVVACVSILLAIAAPPVIAQSGSMSMGLYGEESSFRPDLSSRDLKVIVRVLQLRPEVERALTDLYAGYASSLETEGAQVKEFVNSHIERAEIMQDTSLLKPAQERLSDWTKHSEQIKKGFLADLKSLLTAEQESRWPIVERELRRMKNIGDGRLSGESIDLVRLTEDALGTTPPSQELADMLNRYSDELDRAMTAREDLIEQKRKGFEELIKSDPKAALAAWQEATKARASVRDVNDRYLRQITPYLTTTQAAELNKLFFEQSYRAVTKPTRMDEYLKNSDELKNLTPGQKASLAGLKARYETDKRAVLERQARAWRDFEMEAKPSRLAEALGERPRNDNQLYNGAWLPETNPLVQSRKDRLELDQTTRKALDAILTDEQKAAIPSRLTPYANFDNWEPWGL